MKNLIQAAVAILFAASAAQAQQAVQWKVSDGGNGHWYQWLREVSGRDWNGWRAYAESIGGHLATLTTAAESDFVTGPSVFQESAASINGGSAFFGAFQPSGSPEAYGGWQWVTGEPFVLDLSQWRSLEDCCGGSYCNYDGEDAAALWSWAGDLVDPLAARKWNDVGKCLDWWGAVIEWSADCNSDGAVDFGQCHDGSLPDYNGNNIPDCCERAEACVIGSYPVQWRVEDGGNGHWYLAIGSQASYESQADIAAALGGKIVTIANASENAFVYGLAKSLEIPSVWIGLEQSPVAPEPDGGWRWSDGDESAWRYWGTGEPNNWQYDEDHCKMVCSEVPVGDYWASRWQDYPSFWNIATIIEFDADCNNDGFVDYGQILTGQLADLNSNGIPDVCEQPTCHDVDLYTNGRIDGADLAALLSEWGPSTPTIQSDFNHDGVVDGSDLSKILGLWGPCPN
jgi:hypothetical protein